MTKLHLSTKWYSNPSQQLEHITKGVHSLDYKVGHYLMCVKYEKCVEFVIANKI